MKAASARGAALFDQGKHLVQPGRRAQGVEDLQPLGLVQ